MRWAPGRLLLQFLLICFIVAACAGMLGVEGAIGIIVIMGIVIIVYAIVRSTLR